MLIRGKGLREEHSLYEEINKIWLGFDGKWTEIKGKGGKMGGREGNNMYDGIGTAICLRYGWVWAWNWDGRVLGRWEGIGMERGWRMKKEDGKINVT